MSCEPQVSFLQHLIDGVGHNENLKNCSHDSSSNVYEFLVYIGDCLQLEHVEKAKIEGCWASLVGDTTDMTTLQQLIFFVQYIHKGEPKTFFLDIRLLDTGCATATNICKTLKLVADNYSLDVQENIANATDGAHAMVGSHNWLDRRSRPLMTES